MHTGPAVFVGFVECCGGGAEAITTKLLTDEVLARDVYKRLHAKTMRDTRLEDKRRSGA